jgi:asparagine synthase (glutamine-hydrolysing)
MSVQFGKCNFDGKAADPKDLDQVRPVLAPYGPDSEGYLCKDNIGVLYRAYHTTKEARNEVQPHVSASAAVITWDGRLDNRDELIQRLTGKLSPRSTDLEIVAAACEQWGSSFLRNLIGDWALVVWNPKDRSIILAKDFVGTRHLYYSVEKDVVTWCTILDPLILLSTHRLTLDEQYVAGWFSVFPETHLTPYVGIHSVPPSCFVRLEQRGQTVTKYWDFEDQKAIRYSTDREYEEHFRTVFAESVRRRLRSHRPILAELSGGMDSSSIVCMADALTAQGVADAPRVDTVSYYDDREPHWNERPYLAKVEQARGRTGLHIDLSLDEPRNAACVAGRFTTAPTFEDSHSHSTQQFVRYLDAQDSRVVLSGIGGDEVTGGVPTPVPELGDLLFTGRLGLLAHQLKIWALNKRKPWFYLLFEVLRKFAPVSGIRDSNSNAAAPWLDRNFTRRNREVLQCTQNKFTLLGPLPSFQQNLCTLDALRRQLACSALSSEPTYEKRYPYLDRSFLEFLYAVPPEQLVRPGQRRSLMRRALAGIVPEEILNRKRKAYATRGPLAAVTREWTTLLESGHQTAMESLGIVDSEAISQVLQNARSGREIPVTLLARTLALEHWLRELQHSSIARHIKPGAHSSSCSRTHISIGRTVFSAENKQTERR